MPRFQVLRAIAGVLIGVAGLVDTPEAAVASFYVCQQAAYPVNSMGTAYGLSPSFEAGFRFASSAVDYRVSAAHTMLVSSRDTLPAVVYHGSVAGDVFFPRAFDAERLYALAGIGLGTRRLPEGRVVYDERKVDAPWSPYGYYVVRDTIAGGFGARVVDLIGRVGIGFVFHESPRWRGAIEARYQAAFGIGSPPGITLDMRTDETIGAGVTIEWVRPFRHR
ncbi:MAG TPA: hypothetical protein PLE60_07280 [Candidatus Latescibacteria bacterium]|nr:MAG: hypothetical protein BWY06_00788 [Candidatus Latescibacteria bacterium ADurb.Bin168]HPU85121.1 hypothetical protein [Candidatus Latescibacterota bacterium]